MRKFEYRSAGVLLRESTLSAISSSWSRVTAVHQSVLRTLVAPFLPVHKSYVASLALGLRTSCLPDYQQADACRFLCRSMHMDVQVRPLNKGLRPVKRASLLTGVRKGHLSTVTNSVSLVTFITVPFISLCYHFTPTFKHCGGLVLCQMDAQLKICTCS